MTQINRTKFFELVDIADDTSKSPYEAVNLILDALGVTVDNPEPPYNEDIIVRDGDGDIWVRTRSGLWYLVGDSTGTLTWEALLRRHSPVTIYTQSN